MRVFDAIYRRNGWHGVESYSGPGSGSAATARMSGDLLRLVDDLEVRSVLDAACGDSFWMPDLPGYVGVDIAPAAVARARANHPDRLYFVGNIVSMGLLPYDLVIFRDAIQHLPLEVGVAALAALRASGSRWLLASTYRGGENVDIKAGDSYSPDLSASPFSMGEPERLIPDGYAYDDGREGRDPRKFLGLWRMA